jgi:hypothetical protein
MIDANDLPALAASCSVALASTPITATRSEIWGEFVAGGIRLALQAIPPKIAAGIEIASPPEPREGSQIKLIFEVDDLDAEKLRLEGLGAVIVSRPWGDLKMC